MAPLHRRRRDETVTAPASAEEIDRFLAAESFTGYQAVALPHGRAIPGRDRSTDMHRVLNHIGVRDKTLLDVGCYYGALPATATELGATATGLELDPERHAIATRAAALAGDRWDVRLGSVDALDPAERFQVVTLLNVIHHIDDPIDFLAKLAAHCSERLVVEFPLAHDISALRYVWDDIDNEGKPSVAVAAKTFFWSRIISLASRQLPLAFVGAQQYHRRWHYSAEAFRIIAEQMVPGVTRVDITPSKWHKYRAVAVLEMAAGSNG